MDEPSVSVKYEIDVSSGTDTAHAASVGRGLAPRPVFLGEARGFLYFAAVRASRIVLGCFMLCFLGFAMLYVPRLTNPLWSDAEFTGWVSPIAHRMLEGQRIYQDFTLPIPPASFALMAAVQAITGRFFLIDELWLCTICQILMLPIGYALVRPFTTARNATLVTMTMVPVIIAAPKEIAYDHTALLVAWASLALLLHGLLKPSGRTRALWLLSAGLAAGFTLAFKSSTGVGAVAACGAMITTLGWIGLRRDGSSARKPLAIDAAMVTAGITGGAVATLVLVAALGGSVPEFVRVVFVDGPALKGGKSQAILNLLSYTIIQTPTHVSFFTALIVAYVLVRLWGKRDAMLVALDPAPPDAAERGFAGWVFAVPMILFVFLVFGLAGLLLAGNANRVPFALQVSAGFGGAGPMIGLFTLLLLLVANFTKAGSFRDRRAIFAALAIGSGVLSLMHNLSDPKHRPLYDNNPIIPLVILSLLILFDQAKSRILKYALVCLMLTGIFGGKYPRWLMARTPVDDPGFWSGLRISNNGEILLSAAKRARELAGPHGTVMTLPEDPMFEALIGRPRPKLTGAIVFVDQFPEHVLESDTAKLNAEPPTVLVLHPDVDVGWNAVYRIWSLNSPAARLQNDFLRKHRGTTYAVDSKYPTWLFDSAMSMSVLVRKDRGTPR